MSKYNLTDIHKGIIKESMSRGGTVNDSFYNIANIADELEGQNSGKDTYPIEVKRLGQSEDKKVTEEIVIRYGEGHKDYFSIYDYKFGEDPTSEENYQTEYPFSLGIPTGNEDGKEWAAKLGFKVEGMNETTKENIKEEEGFTEVSTKEIKFHLDAYRAGNIEGDDLAQAIEEIVFGEIKAPGMEEEKDRPGYHKDGTPKSNDEMSDDEREDFYMNLDSVPPVKETKSEDEALKEHFSRFMKDYQ